MDTLRHIWATFSLPLICLVLLSLLLVVYPFVVLYLYSPLKIRRNQTKEVTPAYIPIELTDLPPEIASAFRDAAQQLAPCGFVAIGHLRHHTWSTGQDGFVSVWVNRSQNDCAEIVAVITPSHVVGTKVARALTFCTEFKDRTSIDTSNGATASCFPADERVSRVRCPGIQDLALLYRFHRARVDRDRGKRTPTLERATDAEKLLQFEHTDTFERLIASGYYKLDPSGPCYVPTLKGAYLMTWKLLPPFKKIQKMRKDRLADRKLRELGFGGLEAFIRSQSKPIASDAPARG